MYSINKILIGTTIVGVICYAGIRKSLYNNKKKDLKTATEAMESQKKFDEEGFVEDFQKGEPTKFNDNLTKLSQSKILEGNQKMLEKVAEPVTVAAKSIKRQEAIALKDDAQRKIAKDFDEEGFIEDFQKGKPKKI